MTKTINNSNIQLKLDKKEGDWGNDQSTLHACMEMLQWNPFVLLIYAQFKKKVS
jgi:hypothetical protein